MKSKLTSILCFVAVGFSAFLSAQFNTITYAPPAEKAKPTNIFDKKEPLIDEKKEEKESKKERKKDAKKRSLFGGTTKAELKKDIDSLKGLIIKMGNAKKAQKLKDSLVTASQEKQGKTTHFAVKKFEFISEPQMISKIAMPLNRMVVTSPFGVRTHPIFGGQKMHNGIDLGASYENVYAVLDGMITEAGWDNKGGGHYIKVRHSNRFETSYLHLSQMYYRAGEFVKAGYIIGKSGNSGNSTGPHLHFAVKEYGQYINPTTFLNDLIKINNLISIQNEQQQLTNR